MSEEQETLGSFSSDSRTEWVMKELDEVAHINLGQSPKGEYYNKDGDGPHFLQGSKNFGIKYPELDRFCSKPKREADKGDVLISVRAPVGPVNVAPERVCIGRGVTALRMNEGDNDYLYYYLKNFNEKNKWSQYAGGTTFNSINKSDLQNLEIPYPPVQERNKIASILRNFDDKIRTNNRINELLENIAQTLYRSWFVDFDPYDEFKHSELGEIPVEFEVTEFGDLCKTYSGGPRKNTDDYIGDKYKWLTAKDVSSNSICTIYKTERKLNEKAREDNVMKLMEPNSVLLTSRATIGEVIINKEPMATNQGYICMEPSKDVPPHYLLHMVNSKKKNIKNRASGSTYPEISQSGFESIPVPLAPKEDRIRYEELISPIYDYMYHNLKENETLAELRDTFLPNLMSGEVRLNPDTNNELVSDN